MRIGAECDDFNEFRKKETVIMKDIETKERFIELRARGMSFNAIAKELKTSKATLIDWSKELELQISNLRTMELEVLQDQYYASKQKRLELFGKKLEAIRTELEKRDLKDVPTEKLFDLLAKYGTILKDEETPVCFSMKSTLEDVAAMLGTVDRWAA